jgi:1-acyl-sn-glycerol-3-phosphate acyltransferase
VRIPNYFPDDEYHTPADHPRALGDLLLLGTRWYFYLRVFRVMWDSMHLSHRGLFDEAVWADKSRQMIRCAEDVGVHCHFSGMAHLAEHDGAVVFVGNHMSSFETFALASLILPRQRASFVVKESLLNYPVFGATVRAQDPIPVGRQNPMQDFRTVMRLGLEMLERDRSVILFPQATRMINFDPGRFNTMGIKLARAARVPVIPIAIKTDFWNPSPLIRDLGPIHRHRDAHIHFGAPVTDLGNARRAHEHVIAHIQNKLREWGSTIVATVPAHGEDARHE